jgi:NADH-quinone oxidoreductase subunit E
MSSTEKFVFNEKNLRIAEETLTKYPKENKRSAILPLLDLAQRQNNGWLSRDAIEYIGELLDLSYIRVYEVASFYSMFNLKPVGKYHVQICGTTPCWLKGADKIRNICEQALKIKLGETTQDQQFTLSEIECLGACVNAPVVQINDDYYEDLDEEKMQELLKKLSNQ